ncbi:sensor histidine kinase [Kribbella sp. CA-293567]|uniref:sensor histidine kinase n=1 Tax=Kribbella sp. CA-293567 TaxID=3002436 RepID=UPI0022DE24CF|nr:HAMP domain-containing sensor histidine kinase [Kribbella sp. CA-293567]WBQ02783.1 HAMP domain-containing sensor histidine kinase [Kribbella sp. CA-293567]
MKRLSLRVRLLLITLALLLAGLGAGSVIVATLLQTHLQQRMDSELRSVGELLRLSPISADPRPGELDAQRLALGLELFGSPYFVFLDPQGNVTSEVHSPRIPTDQLPGLERLRRVQPNGPVVSIPTADGSWRAVALERPGQGGLLVVAGSFAEADATVARVRTSSLVAGAALLVVLTVAGWFAVNGGLRPLRRIEHTAAAIAAGDLSRRVPELAAPTTEIGRLSISLNTMLGQLERAFADRAASEARMRTFVSDVSHELRTPLFGIKGSTELYRMGALPHRADVDATMQRIDREASRLAILTEDLLLLAQLDEAPGGQLDPAPLDLRTLANDARHDLRALDPSRPVELTGPGGGPPGPAPMNGDEARLRQVVTNLVGNAVAHTPPGTAVRIGVGTIGDRAILEIADAGPGMTAELAGRAFDRFYRADRSRDRSGGANAGLGLAIARSLTQAHHGEIELETSVGNGARFRLTFPCLPAETA